MSLKEWVFMKKILKVLTLAAALVLLTACAETAQNSTDSSENSQPAHFQGGNSDNRINSDTDISSADADFTVNDDNAMTDIFSESEENTSKEKQSDSADAPESSSIISASSGSEHDKDNMQTSDEWSKRY